MRWLALVMLSVMLGGCGPVDPTSGSLRSGDSFPAADWGGLTLQPMAHDADFMPTDDLASVGWPGDGAWIYAETDESDPTVFLRWLGPNDAHYLESSVSEQDDHVAVFNGGSVELEAGQWEIAASSAQIQEGTSEDQLTTLWVFQVEAL